MIKKNGILRVVDISPSSLMTADEAEGFLHRQKNGVVRIRQEDGVELCTRGTPFHDDILRVVNRETIQTISIESLRQILGHILVNSTESPRLLYALLAKMENKADSVWEKPLAQYTTEGTLLGDSPIKTDKTIRPIRFAVANVSMAEEQNLLFKLSDRYDVCLKDFLKEAPKDCEAADKFRLKSGVGRIDCYQTLLTAAIKVYNGTFCHRNYR